MNYLLSRLVASLGLHSRRIIARRVSQGWADAISGFLQTWGWDRHCRGRVGGMAFWHCRNGMIVLAFCGLACSYL